MALPPIYKYLDLQGASLTLRNRTFKHAKPSDFNDTEDLTIQRVFSEEAATALDNLVGGVTGVILQHLNDPPACDSPMKEKVALIQQVLRAKPEAAELIKAELAKGGGEAVFDVEPMRGRVEAFVNEINEFMQGYRVLCVTTHKDSERMWTDYANNHKGIALRIEPNIAKDSKFQLFRPVIYRAERPPLYEDAIEFVAGSLFGDQEARRKLMLEKILYSKTLDWKHESEFRLVVPMRQSEEPWDTLPYHSEEITELYLGLSMEKQSREEIVYKARAVNPAIAVHCAIRSDDGTLGFHRI